jgi:hypothetical protein
MKKIDSFNKISKYLFLLILLHTNAQAGKVEDVQHAVYETCKINVSADDALRLVKDLYRTCKQDEPVKISASCAVSCLKQNKQSKPDSSNGNNDGESTDRDKKKK